MSNPYRPPDPAAPPRPPSDQGGPAGEQPPGAPPGQGPHHPAPHRPQSGPPFPPPAPQRPVTPPDPEALAAAGRRIRDFALFLLAALLTSSLPVPWLVGSALLAVGAVVAGVRAVVAVWRTGVRSAMIPVLAVGVGFAAMFAVSISLQLAFWPLVVERQDCLRDALTLAAREQCQETFDETLQDRVTRGLTPRP